MKPPRTTEGCYLTVNIDGFVSFSEGRDPADAMSAYAFWKSFVPAVQSQGGDVLMYIGDSARVFFESSGRRTLKDCALSACRAALAHRTAEPSLPLTSRIAIATGPAVAGDFGSGQRVQFNVLGQASTDSDKMMALAKSSPARIVVDARTRELARAEFRFSELDLGSPSSPKAFELLGHGAPQESSASRAL